jgi:hypothetical protein
MGTIPQKTPVFVADLSILLSTNGLFGMIFPEIGNAEHTVQ